MITSTANVSRWQGYLPSASLALSDLLQRGARGGRQFTAPERALFAACEFWVAVETRALIAHLGARAADSLRCLSIVYSAMGAHHVARMLIATLGEIRPTSKSPDPVKCLAALQERLAHTQDPVDQLIAGLAHDLGLSAISRPRMAEPCAEQHAYARWDNEGGAVRRIARPLSSIARRRSRGRDGPGVRMLGG